MKRLISLLLLTTLLLCGCHGLSNAIENLGSNIGQLVASDSVLTVADSTVQLAIYPDGCQYPKTFGGYLFRQLNSEQQSIYIKMDNAIFDMQTGFIDVGRCSMGDLELVYHAVRRDRPEYFWLPSSYYLQSVGDNMSIKFADTESDWLCTATERETAEAKIKSELTKLKNKLPESEFEFDTELYLHDWLVSRVTYNKAALSDAEKHKRAWDIVGAIINQKAVCEGYTKAMQVLFNMVGIESTPVTGVSDEPHMWNMVKIDGEWYHLDATTNDSDNMGLHAYFNVTDEVVLAKRTIDKDFIEVKEEALESSTFNYNLPKATSIKNNYFVKTDSYVTSYREFYDLLFSCMAAAIKSGKTRIEIGFAPDLGVGKMKDVASGLNLRMMLDKVNDRLLPQYRKKAYGWSAIKGASAIVIHWENT